MILGGNFWSWPSDLWVFPRLAQTRDRIRSSNCMDTKLLKKLQRKQANKEANPTKRSMQCCPSTWCKFCGHHPYIHTLTIMFLATPHVCHAILELGTDNICGINLQSYNPYIYIYHMSTYTSAVHICMPNQTTNSWPGREGSAGELAGAPEKCWAANHRTYLGALKDAAACWYHPTTRLEPPGIKDFMAPEKKDSTGPKKAKHVINPEKQPEPLFLDALGL